MGKHLLHGEKGRETTKTHPESAFDFGMERAPQTKKTLGDKDFAERSGELSGAICLKSPDLLGMT